jgi:histidine kinase/histidine kinase/DNA gyrase B/HSP90-like ATPase
MAALLRNLGFLRDVVRALPIARGTGHKPDFNGDCQPDGNRCLAGLPTLAVASSARPEILPAASLLCVRILNSLDSFSHGLESLRRGANPLRDFLKSPVLGWQLLMGVWLYGLFAGVSYAVQTRNRLHVKETMAARAEVLAAAARLDAIRARLNPHFLFNALHTLAALVKFHPGLAESAIQRLGDMLRYALKEDGRELVEFAEEYEFTGQYIAFEQLRYEDRLKVDFQIDPESFQFDIPPFSIQTLAENAVHHAISIRPEGGSIWIKCSCLDGRLRVSVRDNGPGGGADTGQSHQFGLRSLQERLRAAYGAELRLHSSPEGFEACFVVPSSSESSFVDRERVGERP